MFDFLFNKPKYYVLLLKKNNNSYDVIKAAQNKRQRIEN